PPDTHRRACLRVRLGATRRAKGIASAATRLFLALPYPSPFHSPTGVPVVLRFSCPRCNKTLKVPDSKAGLTVACRRGGELSMAHEEATPAAREPRGRAASHGASSPSLLARMGWKGWTAVVLVAGAGLLSLLLPAVASLAPELPVSPGAAGYWA